MYYQSRSIDVVRYAEGIRIINFDQDYQLFKQIHPNKIWTKSYENTDAKKNEVVRINLIDIDIVLKLE